MNKTFLSAVVLIILIGLGVWLYSMHETPAHEATDTVTDFGKHMQKVSLLAPNASTTIAEEYAPYVSEDLLARWEANPQSAPGRLTSSPWPDRIEVSSTTLAGTGNYTVTGTVVEKTSTGDSGSFPITATVGNESGDWRITAFSGYPPTSAASNAPMTSSPSEGPITVTGSIVCLPHKDTTGPQTMECAFGVKDDNGTYYALSDNDPSVTTIGNITNGTRVEVTGTFAKNPDSKYQDIGRISVDTVKEISL